MRVVVQFPRYEKHVLRDDDGSLYVQSSDGSVFPVEVERPMGLLPLLESKRDTYPADVIATLPIRQLLTMALTWSSNYWPTLALEGGWVTVADVADPEVHGALGMVVRIDADRSRSSTRHVAF